MNKKGGNFRKGAHGVKKILTLWAVLLWGEVDASFS